MLSVTPAVDEVRCDGVVIPALAIIAQGERVAVRGDPVENYQHGAAIHTVHHSLAYS